MGREETIGELCIPWNVWRKLRNERSAVSALVQRLCDDVVHSSLLVRPLGFHNDVRFCFISFCSFKQTPNNRENKPLKSTSSTWDWKVRAMADKRHALWCTSHDAINSDIPTATPVSQRSREHGSCCCFCSFDYMQDLQKKWLRSAFSPFLSFSLILVSRAFWKLVARPSVSFESDVVVP